jgi:hypothetical protein
MHWARRVWYRLTDPRRPAELAGERTVFHHLQRTGRLHRLRPRILEVGPKHGEDSRLLLSLAPSELVLVDRPDKRDMVGAWLPGLVKDGEAADARVTYHEGLLEDVAASLGAFDLIFCCGVLYHNVDQARMLRTLYALARPSALVVVESATIRRRRLADLPLVEVHWPTTYRDVPTVTHLPSRATIVAWMQMAGFREVGVEDCYSRHLRWQRAVVTGIRPGFLGPQGVR